MRHWIIILCLIGFSLSAVAQQRKISGRILDSAGMPVDFVSVYIHNTSAFCLSDSSGHFELKIPVQMTGFDLIVTRVGFRDYKRSFSNIRQSLVVNPSLVTDFTLNEVTVKARQDPMWKKKWAIFKRALLGSSYFADNCLIENPEDVVLTMVSNNIISASSRNPLSVVNMALGYRITVSLEAFETDGNTTHFISSQYFTELTPKNEREGKKWIRNRLTAYKNSFRDFLVTMIENPGSDKFEIYYAREIREDFQHKLRLSTVMQQKDLVKADPFAFVKPSHDSTEFYFGSRLPLLIFLKGVYLRNAVFVDFPYEFSQMIIPRRFMSFNRYGWINKPNGLFLHNYWGKEGVADLLPYNYHPENKTGESGREEKLMADPGEHPLTVQDSIMPVLSPDLAGFGMTMIADAETIQEIRPETPDGIQADYFVPSRILESSSSMLGLLKSIPGMIVSTDDFTKEPVFYFSGSSASAKEDSNEDLLPVSPCLVLNKEVLCDKEAVVKALNTLDIKMIKSMGAMRYGPATSTGAGALIVTLKP